MNITAIILQLISGGVGGNIAGAVLKKFNLGPVGSSIAGIVGGFITGQALHMLTGGAAAATSATGGMDMSSILSNVGGAGVGGAVLMAIIGVIKAKMSSTSSTS